MDILLIETATQVCSVALACDGEVVIERHSDEPNAHSSKLAVFIDEITKEYASRCGKDAAPSYNAVCVSSGPGSYTGLRIGVSSAKGIAYALGIPLLSIPTLQNMAMQYYSEHPDYDGLVCPMIDARRMECYTAIFSRSESSTSHDSPHVPIAGMQSAPWVLRDTKAEVIEDGIYDQWIGSHKMVFIGDGAAKTRPILGSHPNAIFDEDFRISATGMMHEAERKLMAGEKEDTAYFEPFYLKDFVAKKSVVHGLRAE